MTEATTTRRFAPTKESLNTHPVPDWFHDAKLGIFVHWGLFSVPGYAPRGDLIETLKHDYGKGMLVHPYAEDYQNAIKDPSTPSAAFHRAHYGDMPYDGFKGMFEDALDQWDPDDWVRSFRDAGAGYVVLTTKYHDGFCLWPTEVVNRHKPDWFTKRDLVGELAEAARGAGLRFGVYYSGGIDWTYRSRISRTLGDYSFSTPGGDYPAAADAHVRELVHRYRPDILWNDICWPTDQKTLFRMFADYYAAVPDGIVNDRWKTVTTSQRLMRTKLGRKAFDAMISQVIRRHPDPLSLIKPPVVPHCDYTTPEYTQYTEIRRRKWEMDRGIGNSFGYNREERDEDYEDPEKLLSDFVDAVSKNGNLLLNVGPRGEDHQIPDEQLSRLSFFGDWLRRSGSAVYGTRPWTQAEARTTHGDDVRLTAGEGTVNLVVLGRPTADELLVQDLQLTGTATLLADGSPVRLEPTPSGTRLTFARALDGSFAPALTIRP